MIVVAEDNSLWLLKSATKKIIFVIVFQLFCQMLFTPIGKGSWSEKKDQAKMSSNNDRGMLIQLENSNIKMPWWRLSLKRW